MSISPALSRRRFLRAGLAGAGSLILPSMGFASSRGGFGLAMTNGNTGEKFRHVIMEDGRWIGEAMTEFDWFARDWREDAEYPIDQHSLMILIQLQQMMDTSEPMVLLSGYRTPKTNSKLPGAARNSLHVRGLAIDVTQPGRSINALRRAAVSLGAGGVGYYPNNNFVHVDSGPIRYWNG